MSKKCPHNNCTGLIDIRHIESHAESYGGSISKVLCEKCGRGVNVLSTVKIRVDLIPYVGPATTGDWGGDIPASTELSLTK